MSKWSLILIIFLLSGCASPGSIAIDDIDFSVNDLQKIAIEALPVSKKKESENGRVYTSAYFIVKKGEYEEAPEAKLRNFAEIYVLGDRRPYRIEVRVIVERREDGASYSLVKYDEGLARVITRRIQKALHKRREDRNIIDDFRVF